MLLPFQGAIETLFINPGRCPGLKAPLGFQPAFAYALLLPLVTTPPSNYVPQLGRQIAVYPHDSLQSHNDNLILAIQTAGVERGRNGLCKNKSTEKNPESEEDLLEHRTDQILLICCILGARSFHSMIFMALRWVV